VSLAPCDIKLLKIFYLKSFVASHSQQTSGDAMNNGKQHANDDTEAAKWGELFIVFFLFILARIEMRNLYDVLVMTSEEVASEREKNLFIREFILIDCQFRCKQFLFLFNFSSSDLSRELLEIFLH
jgi:hypothetical protein